MALLRQYPVAGLETVARLADAAETSGPTVLRLVTRLGFDGFALFQQALLGDVADRTASPLIQLDRGAEPDAGDSCRTSPPCLTDSVDSRCASSTAARTTPSSTARRGPAGADDGGSIQRARGGSAGRHLEILRDGVQHLDATTCGSPTSSARQEE